MQQQDYDPGLLNVILGTLSFTRNKCLRAAANETRACGAGQAGTTAPYGPAETQRKEGAAPCSGALIRPRPGLLGSARLHLQLAGRLRPAALRHSEGVGLWWRGAWLRREGLAPPWRRAYVCLFRRVARHLRPQSCVSALRG
ncbi:unnamed protein product [Boreogadus saida]